MQYLLHRIFGWNFDSMSLEVRSKFSRCSYQCEDPFLDTSPLLLSELVCNSRLTAVLCFVL